MSNFIVGIIGLTLGVVVLSGVFIQTVKSANTTPTMVNATGGLSPGSWTSGEIALWGLLTIGGIAGMVYGTLTVFGLA